MCKTNPDQTNSRTNLNKTQSKSWSEQNWSEVLKLHDVKLTSKQDLSVNNSGYDRTNSDKNKLEGQIEHLLDTEDTKWTM